MNFKTKISKHRNAIATIVVLFALAIIYFVWVSNNHFGPSILETPPCQYSSTGFNCTNPAMSPNGTVSFLFSQETGATLYNVHFACALLENANRQPIANTDPYYALLNISTGVHNNSLMNKQRVNITALPCYGQNGTRLNFQSAKMPFYGFAWINYTLSSNAPSANNHWISSIVTTIYPK